MPQDDAVYVTDDRDYPIHRQNQLVICQGGNGDWYVSVAPVDGVSLAGVRISTSGGASFEAPGLTAAIADAYRAIKAAESGKPLPLMASRDEMQAEIDAWRATNPDLRYVPGCGLMEF